MSQSAWVLLVKYIVRIIRLECYLSNFIVTEYLYTVMLLLLLKSSEHFIQHCERGEETKAGTGSDSSNRKKKSKECICCFVRYEESQLHKSIYQLHVKLLGADKTTVISEHAVNPSEDLSTYSHTWKEVSYRGP